MKRNKLMSATIAGLAAVSLFAGACSDDDTVESPGVEEPATTGGDEGTDTTTTTTGAETETELESPAETETESTTTTG